MRRVEDLATYRRALEVDWDAWDIPEGSRARRRLSAEADWERSRAEGSVDVHLALVDGRPAGFSRLVALPAAGVLMGGAVAPWARGRGAYRALVRARWDASAARGVPRLVTSAGAMSRAGPRGPRLPAHRRGPPPARPARLRRPGPSTRCGRRSPRPWSRTTTAPRDRPRRAHSSPRSSAASTSEARSRTAAGRRAAGGRAPAGRSAGCGRSAPRGARGSPSRACVNGQASSPVRRFGSKAHRPQWSLIRSM